MLSYAWTCSCCGRQSDELPVHWSVEAPYHYEILPEDQRRTLAKLSDDFCTIGADFFIRGAIEIPLIGHTETFTWGVWASLSAASMTKVQRVWDSPEREAEGPFFGWLCTNLPLYPETVGLKTSVRLNPPPYIPSIELEPTDHPLAVEQREGMTLQRAIAIAEALLPRH